MRKTTPRRRNGDGRHPFFRIEAHPRVLAAGIAALVSISAQTLYRSVEDFQRRGSAEVATELHELAQRIKCAKAGR